MFVLFYLLVYCCLRLLLGLVGDSLCSLVMIILVYYLIACLFNFRFRVWNVGLLLIYLLFLVF